MGISRDRFGRFVRAAVVSGLLGAAGLVVAAGPVHAQASDPSDPAAEPSDPSDPGDGTTGGTTTGGTDFGTTGGVGSGGSLPTTGVETGLFLLAGAGATAGALAMRRVASRT